MEGWGMGGWLGIGIWLGFGVWVVSGIVSGIDSGIAYLYIDDDTIIFLANTKRQHLGFQTMTVGF